MVISLAVITIRKESLKEVSPLLNQFLADEKQRPGVIRVYAKRAMDNEDTFLLYTEYGDRKAFEASEKASNETQKGVGFILRPYLLKAFYGNFD